MERDGSTISLWQHDINDYKAITEILPPEAEVVVVGGGITGLSTALKLQTAGKKCVLIEARNIGFGTTGGTTAHLNTMVELPYYKIKNRFGKKDAQKVADLTRRVIDLVENNVRKYYINCGFSKKVAYIFSQDDEQSSELEKIVEGSKEVGIEIDYCTSIPASIPFKKAVIIQNQAQMHATKYLHGIAAGFESAGGRIIQNCRMEDITHEKDVAILSTSLGKIKANYVIYATHIPPGVNILHLRCAPYRSYAMAVKLKGDNYPDALIYDMYDPYHYYRTQEVDGTKYFIAGGEDHKSAHVENTETCFENLETYLRQYFDMENIPFRWSSQYFESADGLPYIGHLPGNPKNIFVATGFGGNGITYGIASSIILTDLIINGTSEYKSLFNPNRVDLAGLDKFIKENVDVAKEFIGKRLEINEIEKENIALGEAKVVKYEGTSIALYKEKNGELFALSPSCPHTKCIVGWNNAEKSWDCPCHGSRFSFTGKVLTGPATKDLEIIDLRGTETADAGLPERNYENFGSETSL